MTAKIRNIQRQFTQTHTSAYKNLLVSGCSFTWNNSEQHVCSWPYYLRDIVRFDQVFDCSQSGAGSNHIFNSTINEIETNPAIDNQNTLVLIMWSGLARTDMIATKDVTRARHHMSNYEFDSKFATLSIFNNATKNTHLDQLCRDYKKIVDSDAQIYESVLKIIALNAYLSHKGYEFLFASWKDPIPDLDRIGATTTKTVLSMLDSVPYLGDYADKKQLKEPDGHPSPDGYLEWTRNCLIPVLENKKIIHAL